MDEKNEKNEIAQGAPAVHDEKAVHTDKAGDGVLDAAPRRASVALNIVENPLQVNSPTHNSFMCPN